MFAFGVGLVGGVWVTIGCLRSFRGFSEGLPDGSLQSAEYLGVGTHSLAVNKNQIELITILLPPFILQLFQKSALERVIAKMSFQSLIGNKHIFSAGIRLSVYIAHADLKSNMLGVLFLIVTTFAIDCPGFAGECRPASSPVCGYYQSGSSRTFSDDCIACQSPGIISYSIGQCLNLADLALAFASVPGRNQNQPVVLTDQQPSSSAGDTVVNGLSTQPTIPQAIQNPAVPAINTNDGSANTNFNQGVQTTSFGQPQQIPFTPTTPTPVTVTNPQTTISSTNFNTQPLIPEPQAPPAPAVTVNFPLNVPECSPILASCQRDFNPVCGTLREGLRITFANACTACQFAGLVALSDGSCAPSPPATTVSTAATSIQGTTTVPATYTPSAPISITPTTTVPATYTPSVPFGTQPQPQPQPQPIQPTASTQTAATVQRIVISQPPTKLTGTAFQPVINSWVGCAQTNPTNCPYSYRPVCGMKNDLRRQSFSNPCNACADKTVVSYKLGACSSAETKDNNMLATPCPKNNLGFCSLRYAPVCAYYKNGTSKTASNSCYACLQSGIIAYRNNQCVAAGGPITGGKPRSELCGNNPTEAILCLLQQNLLCGVLSSGRTRTYNNGCEACQDPQMASYTVGKCRN